MEVYLGVDVGSVTTKLALLDRDDELLAGLYLPTAGQPVVAVQRGIRQVREQLPPGAMIKGVAATGSARYLAGAVIGADMVKNEITCQAAGALRYVPDAGTIIEIGGQDSKLIIVRDGMVADFGMNTVCAAGTGSFLDQQAARLGISIRELSRQAVLSEKPVRIAGRCTVFAESDMVYKQQVGHRAEDIIYGLCQALVRNYLGDVGSGREIRPPVVFQGGVAFNQGMVRALSEALGTEVIVPPRHEMMGAVGAALLIRESIAESGGASRFRGFDIGETEYRTASYTCEQCPTPCERVCLMAGDDVLATWGGRCDAWE